MNKNKFILIPALLLTLALASCDGPTTTTSNPTTTDEPTVDVTTSNPTSEDPTTTQDSITSFSISNKAKLQEIIDAKWYVGDADLNFEYAAEPSTINTYYTELSSSDTSVVTVLGANATAVGAGTATITASLEGLTDSIEVTVYEREATEMKTVTVAELLETEWDSESGSNSSRQLYQVTGKISSWRGTATDQTRYGNFYMADLEDPTKTILVYGTSANESSLTYDETSKVYTFNNDQTGYDIENFDIGNTITMIGIRVDYQSTKEFMGYVTNITVEGKDPVTSIEDTSNLESLGVGSSYDLAFRDSNGSTGDDYATFTITSGSEYASLDGRTLTGVAAGSVTYEIRSTDNTDIFTTGTVDIVNEPAISEATVDEIFADTYDTEGTTLTKVNVTIDSWYKETGVSAYGDYYVKDSTGTNVIVYGTSQYKSDAFRYYNGTYHYSSARDFLDGETPIKNIGDTFDLYAIRSDYTRDGVTTKEIVGVLYAENEAPETLTITPTEPSVAVGATTTLSVSVAPAGSSKQVTWTSSNTAVATINAAGVATGVSQGTTTITATSTLDSSVTASVTLTVTGSSTAEIIDISVTQAMSEPTTAQQLYRITGVVTSIVNTTYGNLYVCDPENVENSVYIYGLNATSDGFVKGSNGTYDVDADQSFGSIGLEVGDMLTFVGYKTIYNTTEEFVAYHESHTTPTQNDITDINVTANAASVEVGRSLNLNVAAIPAYLTPEVTWSSSDETKATVSSDGRVTGVAEGSVTITATLTANTSITDSITLTVIANSGSEEAVVGSYDIVNTIPTLGYDEPNYNANDNNRVNDAAELLNIFNSSADSAVENKLSAANPISRVYAGNSSGGIWNSSNGQGQNCGLKIGSTDNPGSFSLTFSGVNVTKVVITCHAWNTTTSETIRVNTETAQAMPKTGNKTSSVTFEGTFGDTVTIEVINRGFVLAIEVTGY